MICKHEIFEASVTVNRLEDSGKFNMDVKVHCVQCKLPFRFIGLPCGLDLNGATVNSDATEARLAIAPKGEVVSMLEGGVMGFSIRKGDNK